MNVLGPFKFTQVGTTEENCGCGGDYCAPFNNNDKISFQIPASENCCEELAGCDELNEDCIADQTLTSDLTFTQNEANICFDTEDFVPDDKLLKGSYNFTEAGTYIICFCLSNNDTALDLAAFIDTEESSQVSGNGNYCLRITVASPGTYDWGIIIKGGDDTVALCLSCMTLCKAVTWTATVVDGDDTEVSTLTETALENGNISVVGELSTGSITPGCYYVKLVNDCNDDEYLSNCFNLQVSHPCTLLFKYRDSKNVFGFDYASAPTYYNYIRAKARIKHPVYPDESGVFRLSDNTNVLTNSVVQKVYQVALDGPGVPEFIHDSIAIMRRHQTFLIDGVAYVVAEGEYQPSWRNSSELATSIFEVLVQDFDGVNNYCG